MQTHKSIARRFKAGASMQAIALTIRCEHRTYNYSFMLHHVEHAIRQVMTRQHAKHYRRKR